MKSKVLYLLSHGFKRDTCNVGLAKLAKSVLMSQGNSGEEILERLPDRALTHRRSFFLTERKHGRLRRNHAATCLLALQEIRKRPSQFGPEGNQAVFAELRAAN